MILSFHTQRDKYLYQTLQLFFLLSSIFGLLLSNLLRTHGGLFKNKVRARKAKNHEKIQSTILRKCSKHERQQQTDSYVLYIFSPQFIRKKMCALSGRFQCERVCWSRSECTFDHRAILLPKNMVENLDIRANEVLL